MSKTFRILSVLLVLGACLSFVILNLKFAPITHAAEIATESGQVTATIPAAPASDDNQAPTSPILIRPTDGSATADPHPELVWRRSTDPDGNTIYYDLYLNGVATYLGISNTGNSADNNYTSTVVDSEVRLIPTTALSDGHYTWLVRAYDLAGDYSNSTTWGFTIDTAPPNFVITSIDTHHDLALDSTDPSSVSDDLSFEVTGPKDIYFTIETEPRTTIQLLFYDSDGSLVTQTSGTTSSTISTLNLYSHLDSGLYTVQALAFDHVLLTTTLPPFDLSVTMPTLTLPIPGITPPITLLIPPALKDLPSTLAHLPATVARISTRPGIAIIILTLIALALLLLLILLKKRRYNLILINPQGTPLKLATIYHSIPDSPPSSHHLHTPAFLTHRAPFRYPLDTSDKGKLYIRKLNRYSTLTIRTKTSLHILSISRYHSPITLIID